MGASVSKTSTEIVNSTIVDAVIEAAQTTNAGMSATQTNDIAGFSFFSANIQNSSVSVQALQQVSIDTKLLEKITQDIKSSAKAEGAMLNPAVANSDVAIKNIIQSKFTNSSFQNCVAFVSAEQTNRVRAGGVSIGVLNLQTSEILASCKVLQGISSDIARELFTETKQNSSSKSKGLLDSMLGNNSLMYIVVFVVFIVVAGMIYSIMNKPVNNGTQNGYPDPNNPSAYGNPNNPYSNPQNNPNIQNPQQVSNAPIDFRSYDPNNPPASVNNTIPLPSSVLSSILPMNNNSNPINAINPINPMNNYNNNAKNPFANQNRFNRQNLNNPFKSQSGRR